MFSDIIQRFVDSSPGSVAVRALLEYLLRPEKLDRWFADTKNKQHVRSILFSSLVGLMLNVVCKTHASVRAAYGHAQIAASLVAVYAKLKNMELTTSEAFVRDLACDAAALIDNLEPNKIFWKPGFHVKYLVTIQPWRAVAWAASPGR